MRALSVSLAASIFAFPPLALAEDPSFTLAAGRLHPAVVHFPIAFLLLATFLEVCQWVRRKPLTAHTLLLLWCGALGAIGAACLGWWNAQHADFHGSIASIVELHRWSGIAVAAVSLGLAAVLTARRTKLTPRLLLATRSVLLITAVALGFSAHQGGTLVHGEDYYEPLFAFVGQQRPRDLANSGRDTDDSSAVLPVSEGGQVTLPEPFKGEITYAKDIHPIFEASCGKCHLNGKAKGDFQMDTRDLILRGGESGPGAIAGDSAKSLMIELVAGIDPENIMPNKGRRLTNVEVAKLRAWIDRGMSFEGAATPAHVFTKADPRPRTVAVPENSPAELTHEVDRFMAVYFEKQGVHPSTVVDDRSFIRRAYLDIVGVTPDYPAVQKFLSSSSERKREELVDSLLSDGRAYATHWLSFWNDILRNDYSGPGFLYGKRVDMSPWLYSALQRNMPLDLMVQAMVRQDKGAEGFLRGILWWKQGFVNIVEDRSMQAAQNLSQVFMGVNLKCASCHNSFTDAWSLKEAFAMTNIFAHKPFETQKCGMAQGNTQVPAFLYPELGDIPKGGRKKRLASLASILTSDANGRFARTFVNRIWHRMTGVGLVEPIDEMDRPSWNADLLDWLASDFVKHEYDIRHLIRTIATSRYYQLPASPARAAVEKETIFEGPWVRRLSAEQFVDSLHRITDTLNRVNEGDVERMIRLLEHEPKGNSDASMLGKPHILFASGKVDPVTEKVDFDVSLEGVDSLWVVVAPRFTFKDSEDVERKRRELIGTQNKQGGATPVMKRYYRALFENTSFVLNDQSRLSLVSTPWLDAVGTQIYNYSPANEPRGEALHGLVEQNGQTLGLNLVSEYGIRPAAGLVYRVKDMEASRFRGSLRFERIEQKAEHKYELLIVANLNPQSVFLEATDLLLGLGRPRREQVATSRLTFASTVESLDLQRSEELSLKLQTGAARLLKVLPQDKDARIREVFRRVLNREPTEDELALTREALHSLPAEEAIEDLLWVLMVSPEFQLIT